MFDRFPSIGSPLHLVQNSLLELAILDLLTRIIGCRLAVKREQIAEIELGCLEELDFADVDLHAC